MNEIGQRFNFWRKYRMPFHVCWLINHDYEDYESHKYNWRCGRMHTYINTRCRRCGQSDWYKWKLEEQTLPGQLRFKVDCLLSELRERVKRRKPTSSDDELPF